MCLEKIKEVIKVLQKLEYKPMHMSVVEDPGCHWKKKAVYDSWNTQLSSINVDTAFTTSPPK